MRRALHCVLLLLAATLASAAAAPAAEKRFSADEVKADFGELYDRLQASHFDLFARRPKTEYDALFQSTLASLDRPLTAVEVQIRFQRFMAFGRVAHSRIEFPYEAYNAYRDGGGRVMPIFVRIVRGRTYVSDNYSGLPGIMPGDEVLTLNGGPMPAWLTRLAANTSADNDYMMETMLERRFAALLWLELGTVAEFKLTLRNSSPTGTVVVPARTRSEIKADADKQSQTLELDWDKREFRMLGSGVGYLRPGPFYNNDPNATNIWDASQFRRFIDASFDQLLRADAKALLIDLRDNPGGDNSFSDPMIAWFATKPFRFASDFKIKASEAAIESNRKRLAEPQESDSISQKFAAAYARRRIGEVFSFDLPMAEPRNGVRFTGKVYLLINRHSYSNTVQVAALAQDYRFATILGEETSDLATTYGAMEQFTLTRTGTVVGFPKAMIIRANGDLAPRGVIPDIAIATPIVEASDDPVLKRAVEIAASGK